MQKYTVPIKSLEKMWGTHLEIKNGEIVESSIKDVDVSLERVDGKPEKAKFQRLLDRGALRNIDIGEIIDECDSVAETISVNGLDCKLEVTVCDEYKTECSKYRLEVHDVCDICVGVSSSAIPFDDYKSQYDNYMGEDPSFSIYLSILFANRDDIPQKIELVKEKVIGTLEEIMSGNSDFAKYNEINELGCFVVEGHFPTLNDDNKLELGFCDDESGDITKTYVVDGKNYDEENRDRYDSWMMEER